MGKVLDLTSSETRTWSSFRAYFKAFTKLGKIDIGTLSVEDVYRFIVLAPGSPALSLDSESLYREAYLPLWTLWAKQHPEEIRKFREESSGVTVVNRFNEFHAKALVDVAAWKGHYMKNDFASKLDKSFYDFVVVHGYRYNVEHNDKFNRFTKENRHILREAFKSDGKRYNEEEKAVIRQLLDKYERALRDELSKSISQAEGTLDPVTFRCYEHMMFLHRRTGLALGIREEYLAFRDYFRRVSDYDMKKNLDKKETEIMKKEDVVFLIGGSDLEMEEIKRILVERNIDFEDKGLGWGAKLSDYADVFAKHAGRMICGIELKADITPPEGYVEIDHHGKNEGKASSIEQVCSMLGVDMSWRQKLVAANDRGYIPAMKEMGATPEEIADIRRQDRKAQGVTEADEKAAEKALGRRYYLGVDGICGCIVNEKAAYDGVCIVRTESNRFAPVTDSLYGTGRILVIHENEFCYYGKDRDKMLDMVSEGFGIPKESFYSGGGEDGYFGLNIPATQGSRVLDADALEDMLNRNSHLLALNPDLTHISREEIPARWNREKAPCWIGKDIVTIDKGVFPDGTRLHIDERNLLFALPVSDDIVELMTFVRDDHIIGIGGVDGGGFVVSSVSCDDSLQQFRYQLDYDMNMKSFELVDVQDDVLKAHGEEIRSSLDFVIPLMNDVYGDMYERGPARVNGVKM